MNSSSLTVIYTCVNTQNGKLERMKMTDKLSSPFLQYSTDMTSAVKISEIERFEDEYGFFNFHFMFI